MLHNLLVPKLTSLKDTNEFEFWDNRPFISKWPEHQESKKEKEVKRTIKKKSKRVRTAFTTEQLKLLENYFTNKNYISSDERLNISKTIKVGEKQIKVWFQNRRMKEKRRSSESSSDSETCSVPSPPLVNASDITVPIDAGYENTEFTTNSTYANEYTIANEDSYIPNYVNENMPIDNFSYNVDYDSGYPNYNYLPSQCYANQNIDEPTPQVFVQNQYDASNNNSANSYWYGMENFNNEYYNW